MGGSHKPRCRDLDRKPDRECGGLGRSRNRHCAFCRSCTGGQCRPSADEESDIFLRPRSGKHHHVPGRSDGLCAIAYVCWTAVENKSRGGHRLGRRAVLNSIPYDTSRG